MITNTLAAYPFVILIGFLVIAIPYSFVLKKAGFPQWHAFIPFLADYDMTTKLYPKKRTFWRPFIIVAVLVVCAIYLNPLSGSGAMTARVFLLLAWLVYSFFVLRLYRRMSKAFGHGFFFWLFMFLWPPIGLAILGWGKSHFMKPFTKPIRQQSPLVRNIKRVGFVCLSLVEILVLVGAVGIFTVRAYPPRILVDSIQNSVTEKTKDVKGGDLIVTREDALGADASKLSSYKPSRALFFPDHSKDESVVVLMYGLGADLEDRAGLLSANIRQMVDSTNKGSALTYVMETGGSKRWFTQGIPDESYGRYTIKDGKLELVEELPGDTCMSEPQTFADFLMWSKQNYPADRYMLVMWDHGGGLSDGYGIDSLNKRDMKDSELLATLSISELVDGIKQADMKFDVIGFDACLMQDIEVAVAFEPYADYFLASEEVEGGYGWFYTTAFGMLAENPGTPSLDFGREIIACYDAYNRAMEDDGKPTTTSTLSFVDLPLAKAAYQQMDGLFNGAQAAIAKDAKSFANVSLAGTKSYTFQNYEQVDLVDFLQRLNALDYEDEIINADKMVELQNAVKACVIYRNADSAEGINGMALSFPVKNSGTYTKDYLQMKSLGMDAQRSMFSDFFSIIAVQKKKQGDSIDPKNASFTEVLNAALHKDLTEEEWYVKGFEDYDDTPAMVDIPLTEAKSGYKIDAPAKLWDIIATQEILLYQKDGDLRRYLGREELSAYDENNHPMVAMDGTWVHVGDKLCCYEAEGSRETEEGTVYTGSTKARLNGTDDIRVYLEWDVVPEDGEGVATGHVVGYTRAETEEIFNQIGNFFGESAPEDFMSKGREQFVPGDRVEFLFDYYDAEGNLAKTETYGGALLVSKQENMDVIDKQLAPCDVEFGGMLTDVYQRTMFTEKIEAHID